MKGVQCQTLIYQICCHRLRVGRLKASLYEVRDIIHLTVCLEVCLFTNEQISLRVRFC